jgi:hypothetical protein
MFPSVRLTFIEVAVAAVVLYFLLRKRESTAGAGTVLSPVTGGEPFYSKDNPNGFNPAFGEYNAQ